MIRSTHVHRRTIAAVVAAVLTLASCSGGGDDDAEASEETTTTTAAETTAPPTTLSPEEAVEAAFHEFDAVMAELGPEPNPDDPRLPEMVLEPKLSEIRDSLAQSVAKNEVYELSPATTSDVVSTTVDATGVTATLVVCAVGDDKVIDRDTGDVVHDDTFTTKNDVLYRQQGGRWMLEDIQTRDSWPGITSCDA